MRFCPALVPAILITLTMAGHSQSDRKNQSQEPTLHSQSTLVQVPTIVRGGDGKAILNLSASDFIVTDDRIPQKHTLEAAAEDPIALVIDVEGGGAGAKELPKYRGLGAMVESAFGDTVGEIALVAFDSAPVLVQEFTPDRAKASNAVERLVDDDSGDNGAAVLDSIAFSADLLRKQPPQYRRIILLISETVDSGSRYGISDVLRSLSDSNTTIYAFSFSSAQSYAKREGPKTLGQGPIPWLSSKDPPPPGPARGCMSRDKDDPEVDLSKNRAEQLYDCLSLVVPPLRLAKIGAVVTSDAVHKNAPKTLADLTGGEYLKIAGAANLEEGLRTAAERLPDRYILSFQPQSPHAGFHLIGVRLLGYPAAKVVSKYAYWANADGVHQSPPPDQSH